MEYLYWNLQTALICLGIALAITTVVMLVKRSKLKSVRQAHTACDYVRPGSFRLTNQRDTFLFSTITRVPKPQAPKR